MSEKPELTTYGRKVISAELIGQNADLEFLAEPEVPAYPKGNEIIYTDDYLVALNEEYPLNEILAGDVEKIIDRRIIPKYIIDSPLQNSEGEHILDYMLINSARAGEWHPYVVDVSQLTDTPIKTAVEYLERVDNINPNYNKGKIHGGNLFGLAVAKRSGFALPIVYDEKLIALPSQRFVEFLGERNATIESAFLV